MRWRLTKTRHEALVSIHRTHGRRDTVTAPDLQRRSAQEQSLRIKYWLAMSRPASHLFEVTIEVELPSDPICGRLIFDAEMAPLLCCFRFAKNVQRVKAYPVLRARLHLPESQTEDDQTWRVAIERNRHEACR
jgi:hypothetical protein